MADVAVSFPVTPADPNQDRAMMEASTLESLRQVQHKDSNGNVISKFSPDVSTYFLVTNHVPQPNPTFRIPLVLAGKDLWIPLDRLKELLMVVTSVAPSADLVRAPSFSRPQDALLTHTTESYTYNNNNNNDMSRRSSYYGGNSMYQIS